MSDPDLKRLEGGGCAQGGGAWQVHREPQACRTPWTVTPGSLGRKWRMRVAEGEPHETPGQEQHAGRRSPLPLQCPSLCPTRHLAPDTIKGKCVAQMWGPRAMASAPSGNCEKCRAPGHPRPRATSPRMLGMGSEVECLDRPHSGPFPGSWAASGAPDWPICLGRPGPRLAGRGGVSQHQSTLKVLWTLLLWAPMREKNGVGGSNRVSLNPALTPPARPLL